MKASRVLIVLYVPKVFEERVTVILNFCIHMSAAY